MEGNYERRSGSAECRRFESSGRGSLVEALYRKTGVCKDAQLSLHVRQSVSLLFRVGFDLLLDTTCSFFSSPFA